MASQKKTKTKEERIENKKNGESAAVITRKVYEEVSFFLLRHK